MRRPWGRPQALDPVRQAGACGIVPKPFAPRQLALAINATLDYLSHDYGFDNQFDLEVLRVLLVDDSANARRFMRRVLENLGISHIIEAADGKAYVKALRAPLQELAGAYSKMLSEVEAKMLAALDASRDDLQSLRDRAKAVSGISGDYQIDGFATRLANYDGSRAALEGILSMAAERPPRDWVDRHIDAAVLELAKFARRFRESEAFACVQGRSARSEAIAVVIGAGADTKTISRSFAIPDRHRKTVEAKADEIALMLEGQGLETDVLLAILAKAGMKLASIDKETANG